MFIGPGTGPPPPQFQYFSTEDHENLTKYLPMVRSNIIFGTFP